MMATSGSFFIYLPQGKCMEKFVREKSILYIALMSILVLPLNFDNVQRNASFPLLIKTNVIVL